MFSHSVIAYPSGVTFWRRQPNTPGKVCHYTVIGPPSIVHYWRRSPTISDGPKRCTYTFIGPPAFVHFWRRQTTSAAWAINGEGTLEFVGTLSPVWRLDGEGTLEWESPELAATWQIDGLGSLDWESDFISFWVIQGVGTLVFVPAAGGVATAWSIDGLGSLEFLAAATNHATMQIDGEGGLSWIARVDGTSEGCLTDDGDLPVAPRTGSNYVF
jgi:hypothetical protein